MENKHVGYLILGISVLVIGVIILFNITLNDIVDSSCGATHGEFCPMYDTITKQTYLALGIVGLLVVVGLILAFTKPKETIVIKKVKEKKKRLPGAVEK